MDQLTKQPVKGRKKGGGIRFGEMERDGLVSHGSLYLLYDRLFNCSDESTVRVSPQSFPPDYLVLFKTCHLFDKIYLDGHRICPVETAALFLSGNDLMFWLHPESVNSSF